jgi:hypothetical protein
MQLHGEYEPHAGSFSVEVITDGVSQGVIPIQIGAGLSVYGTGTYGTGTYGGFGRRKFYTVLPLTSEGRTATVKGTYIGSERFKWFNYALAVLPEPKPRQISE